MINKFFAFTQSKTSYLYKNSLILQKLDSLILILILAVFVFSTFASSDVMGIFATIVTCLTLLNLCIKTDDELKCNKTDIFLVAYFMFIFISLLGSSMFALSLHGFIKLIIYFGFYISTVHYLKNNKDKIWWIVLTIAMCVSYETIQGLMQTFLRPAEISTWQDTSYLNPEQIMSRVYGTLKPLNPNLLGGYMVASIPALLASAIHEFYYKRSVNAYILSGLYLLAIYVTFSTGCRGAYLGLFAGIITLAVISGKFFWNSYKKIYLSVSSAILTLSLLFVTAISSLRARIFSIFAMRADSSNSFRFNVYHSCIEMFRDNWLLGIGIGNQNFREIYGLYMKTGFDALSAYNIYLEIAVESGIFALIAFLAFLGLVLYDAFQFIKNTNDIKSIIFVSAAIISLLGLIVHGFVDTVFFRPQIHFIFWTMIAIINVLTQKNKNI